MACPAAGSWILKWIASRRMPVTVPAMIRNIGKKGSFSGRSRQNRMPEKYTAGQNRKLEVSQTVKHKMLLPTEEDMVKVQRMVHMKLNLDNVKLPESTGIPASQGVYDDDYDEDEDNDAVNV